MSCCSDAEILPTEHTQPRKEALVNGQMTLTWTSAVHQSDSRLRLPAEQLSEHGQ
jgi:hypothetical protein